MTVQVALDQRILQPDDLFATQHGLGALRAVRDKVGVPVLTGIEDEHLQVLAPTDIAVEAFRRIAGGEYRVVVQHRLEPHGHQVYAGGIGRCGTGVVQRPKIVDDFMVVPDGVIGHARQQAPVTFVFAVVAPVPPVIRHVGGLQELARHLGVAIKTGRAADPIGVDHVTETDEEIHRRGIDGLEDRKAFHGITADVLPRQIATPTERHSLGLFACERCAEVSFSASVHT